MLSRNRSLISIFLRNPVAANLLMLIMFLSGAWALTQLNTQFLPNFKNNNIDINVVWTGASAEDVETSITIPIENELRSVDYVKDIRSESKFGSSKITLEFYQGTDLSQALDQVEEKVALVKNLPEASEAPEINKQEQFEVISKLLIKGPSDLEELRTLVHNMERDLLRAGIAKVDIVGLPEQMIAVTIPMKKLMEMRLSLLQVAERINQRSQDFPAGIIGRGSTGQQLRSLEQRRSAFSFNNIPLISDPSGHLLELGEVADIKRVPRDDEIRVTQNGQDVVELILYRTDTSDALKSAEILEKWFEQVKPDLPDGVEIVTLEESWRLIDQRINLLLKNGVSGLCLILVLLFLFLNWRVGFWVAMGIPVSFMAALAVLYFAGGSINMVTLFALIMTLGIIVDDTIVVGEEALTQLTSGHSFLDAVEIGAHRMLAPIFASSLTTISAFLPLFLISGIIGEILSAIPLVVICTIIASVVECFLVLPGHLYHSFKNIRRCESNRYRRWFDEKFNYFRQIVFRKFIFKAIRHRIFVIVVAFALLILSVILVKTSRVEFTFFPSPDSQSIHANIQFHAGTTEETRIRVLNQIEQALQKTNDESKHKYNEDIIVTSATYLNEGAFQRGRGNTLGSVVVELTPPDNRKFRNQSFINAWHKNILMVPSIENIIISSPRSGPPGEDVDILLTGRSAEQLKKAALALEDEIVKYQGVINVADDMPFGQSQMIFNLTPEGQSINLTTDNVGRQLHAAFTGELVQIFHEPDNELEVRVMLPEEERDSLNTLQELPIITPTGNTVPLNTVAEFSFQRGFDIIRHTDSQLSVRVMAEVDQSIANANQIRNSVVKNNLPELIQKYGVQYQLKGRAEEQSDTLSDMMYGILLALTLIYIILAWVFASYGWPIIVMIAIPLGLTGAVFGHWVMGFDLTILSLFGFFGLAGIVINDSIILISTYKNYREQGIASKKAIVQASMYRLRAVLLTSLTTIAGLSPLLMETSLQAQFLIPMAISISFGLAFGTVLILIVVPALLSVYEDGVEKFLGKI